MAILGVVKFDFNNSTQDVIISGATRYDITVTGAVDCLNQGNTVKTITNTTESYPFAGVFTLSAAGAVSGKVVGVEEGGR